MLLGFAFSIYLIEYFLVVDINNARLKGTLIDSPPIL